MDIRYLTDSYAVSPQIALADVEPLKAAGFETVICNRPDAEIPPDLHAAAIKAKVEAAGLRFVDNPVISGALTDRNVAVQRAAIETGGKVFAYCASGNRSSVVWALSLAGQQSADALIGAAARFGYQLEWLRPQLASADGAAG